MTASCERLRCIAYPIALLIAFGSAYHCRPNGSASLIRSSARILRDQRTWHNCNLHNIHNLGHRKTNMVLAVSFPFLLYWNISIVSFFFADTGKGEIGGCVHILKKYLKE